MKVQSLFFLVARTAGLPDSQIRLCERVLRALGPSIVKVTAKGHRVSLPGLGVFRGRARKAREFDLPQGGHHVIEPRVVLTFRASQSVRVLRSGK